MKKSLESLQAFETQTEQELHEVMGGAIASNATAMSGVALAYGVMVAPFILSLIEKLKK